MPKNIFEPWTSGIGSNYSTNWATTPACLLRLLKSIKEARQKSLCKWSNSKRALKGGSKVDDRPWIRKHILWLSIVSCQCDQIGLFLKVIGYKFSCKSCPKFFNAFWSIYKNVNFQVKPAVRIFGANLWKIWATFRSNIWSHWICKTAKKTDNKLFR